MAEEGARARRVVELVADAGAVGRRLVQAVGASDAGGAGAVEWSALTAHASACSSCSAERLCPAADALAAAWLRAPGVAACLLGSVTGGGVVDLIA